MSDDRLRKLKLALDRSGSPIDRVAYLREWRMLDGNRPEKLNMACLLGDPIARLADDWSEENIRVFDSQDLSDWILVFTRFGPEVCTRIMLAVARLVMVSRESQPARYDDRSNGFFKHTLRAVERWIQCPCSKHEQGVIGSSLGPRNPDRSAEPWIRWFHVLINDESYSDKAHYFFSVGSTFGIDTTAKNVLPRMIASVLPYAPKDRILQVIREDVVPWLLDGFDPVARRGAKYLECQCWDSRPFSMINTDLPISQMVRRERTVEVDRDGRYIEREFCSDCRGLTAGPPVEY